LHGLSAAPGAARYAARIAALGQCAETATEIAEIESPDDVIGDS
jgi:hypothetical protein